MNQKSQQIERGERIFPALPSSIEISESVAKKLSQICVQQNIPVKELVSTLLQRMLLDHHKETKEIVERFRCHPQL